MGSLVAMRLLWKPSRGLGKSIHFLLAPLSTKIGAPISHFFNGNRLNRNSEKREDKAWLSKVFHSPGAKVALFQKSDPLFTPCGTSIKWVSPRTLSPLKLDGIFKEENAKDLPLLVYLGSKGDSESFWALQLDGLQPNHGVIGEVTRDGGKFAKFRPGVFNLKSSEAAVMSQARAILDWNSKSQYCPSCGNKTVAGDMGYKRICFSSDPTKQSCSQEGSPKNYMHPRTDPVTIVCVSSEDGELCLLGRKADWPKDVYSCVAGFIEPGESIEVLKIRAVW
ncbi:NADH pyrophosphatase [Entomophthora muscae]|uniref:NADH pyrophosphatase n=1 Tax=Entomophthora muscae TaxID=34485 RepID=A0ACC2U382_9FUNG|nr:NADH pyrophosphatase [Entomophthora muscae]